MADNTVPIFSPDGSLKAIPQDQAATALSNGGRLAVKMSAPSGDHKWIPEDRVKAASAAGGQIVGAPPASPFISGLPGNPSPSLMPSLRDSTDAATNYQAAPNQVSPDVRLGNMIPESLTAPLAEANKYAVQPFDKAAQAGGKAGADILEGTAARLIQPFLAPDLASKPTVSIDMMEQRFPTTLGVSRGIGQVIGSTVSDPRNWPFLAGGEVRPLLKKAISAGFTTLMAKGTADQAVNLHNNWDNLTPTQRAEGLTATGLSALFTAGGLTDTLSKTDRATTKPAETPQPEVPNTPADVGGGSSGVGDEGLHGFTYGEPRPAGEKIDFLNPHTVRPLLKGPEDVKDFALAAFQAAKEDNDNTWTVYTNKTPLEQHRMLQNVVDNLVKEDRLGKIDKRIDDVIELHKIAATTPLEPHQQPTSPQTPIRTGLEGVPFKEQQAVIGAIKATAELQKPEYQADLSNWTEEEKAQFEKMNQKTSPRIPGVDDPERGSFSMKPIPPIKRAADFQSSGNYDVQIGKLKTQIYRDPENGMWYENIPGKHFSETWLGYTKEDVLEKLNKRSNEMGSVATDLLASPVIGLAKGFMSARDAMAPKEPTLTETSRNDLNTMLGTVERNKQQTIAKLSDWVDTWDLASNHESRAFMADIEGKGATYKGAGPSGINTEAYQKEVGGVFHKDVLGMNLKKWWTTQGTKTDLLRELAAKYPTEAATHIQQQMQFLRGALDARRERIHELTGNFDSYIENYFPHFWENPRDAAALADAKLRISDGKAPLQGRATFLRQREHSTFEAGLDAGLEPITYNPIKLAMMKMNEMDKYIASQELFKQYEKTGMIKSAPEGPTDPNWRSDIPGHWRKLDMNIFKKEAYAPPELAQVLKNYLKPSALRDMPAYQMIKNYNNLGAQAVLGLSLFHLKNTLLYSTASDAALALQKVSKGDLSGLINGARAISGVGSPLAHLVKGEMGFQEYLRPGSFKKLSDVVNTIQTVDGRINMGEAYESRVSNTLHKNWKKAWDDTVSGKDRVIAGAKVVQTAPFVALKTMSKPLMNYIVPRIKLGAFMDKAQEIMGRVDPQNTAQLKKELNLAWDSIDNRFGEVVSERRNWSQTAQDIANTSMLASNYTFGTLLELGGGVKDAAKSAAQLGTFNKTEISNRTAFTAGLIGTIAYMSTIYQYMHTGKMPQSTADYMNPRTGKVDKDGNPIRLDWGSYLDNMRSLKHDPMKWATNRLSVSISQAAQLIQNKDFLNQEIHDWHDPLLHQGKDIGEWYAQTWLPMAITNQKRMEDSGLAGGEAMEAYMGLRAAPRWVGQSKAFQYVSDQFDKTLPKGPFSKEAVAKRQGITQLKQLYNAGKMSMVQVYRQAQHGSISFDEADTIIDQKNQSGFQRMFSKIGANDMLRAYEMGTNDEKAQMKPLIKNKYFNMVGTESKATTREFKQKMQQLGVTN